MHNTASPDLSGGGRLVLKDTVILAGGWLLVVDGARIAGADGPPFRGGKSRLEPFRRPSTPLTAAACSPTYRV